MEKDWWDDLSEKKKATFETGNNQIETGQTISYQEVKDRFLDSGGRKLFGPKRSEKDLLKSKNISKKNLALQLVKSF